MSDFKTLKVWQKAHALSLSVDRACKGIRAPMYVSLRNQLFRAAMSIAANIAEGSSQRTRKEFGRFVGIALRLMVFSAETRNRATGNDDSEQVVLSYAKCKEALETVH